jgi:hypothetical protein
MARVNILDTSKSSPYCVKLILMLQLEKLAIFGSAVFNYPQRRGHNLTA